MPDDIGSGIQHVSPRDHAVIPAPFDRNGTSEGVTHTKCGSKAQPFGDHSDPFLVIHKSFNEIIGSSPSLRCLAKDNKEFAHEAGVWVESTQKVWLTSNLYNDGKKNPHNPDLENIRSEISVLDVSTGQIETRTDLLKYIGTPNGGCPFGDYVLLCEQGAGHDRPSAFIAIDPKDLAKEPITILNNYLGRHFNSLNDAVLLPPPKGVKLGESSANELPGGPPPGWTLWFTDPTYGHEQRFRPPPQLPCQVYCFDPHAGTVRAVADGFDHSNGICFNPEGNVCYVTDSGIYRGCGTVRYHLPATIYAFDVVWPDVDMSVGGPTLTNRRLFAHADTGCPDGIKCDNHGNVYSGCGDGIHVWNKYGTLIGKILLRGTCANFCFIPGGRIVAFAEKEIFLVEGLTVEGDLLRQQL